MNRVNVTQVPPTGQTEEREPFSTADALDYINSLPPRLGSIFSNYHYSAQERIGRCRDLLREEIEGKGVALGKASDNVNQLALLTELRTLLLQLRDLARLEAPHVLRRFDAIGALDLPKRSDLEYIAACQVLAETHEQPATAALARAFFTHARVHSVRTATVTALAGRVPEEMVERLKVMEKSPSDPLELIHVQHLLGRSDQARYIDRLYKLIGQSDDMDWYNTRILRGVDQRELRAYLSRILGSEQYDGLNRAIGTIIQLDIPEGARAIFEEVVNPNSATRRSIVRIWEGGGHQGVQHQGGQLIDNNVDFVVSHLASSDGEVRRDLIKLCGLSADKRIASELVRILLEHGQDSEAQRLAATALAESAALGRRLNSADEGRLIAWRRAAERRTSYYLGTLTHNSIMKVLALQNSAKAIEALLESATSACRDSFRENSSQLLHSIAKEATPRRLLKEYLANRPALARLVSAKCRLASKLLKIPEGEQPT